MRGLTATTTQRTHDGSVLIQPGATLSLQIINTLS